MATIGHQIMEKMTSSFVSKHINRPTLVCNRCKARKVKCNRQLPCSSCIRRGCESDCSYGNAGMDSQEGYSVSVFETRRYAAPIVDTPDSMEGGSVGSSTGTDASGTIAQGIKVPRGFDYTGVNLWHSKDELINFYDVTDISCIVDPRSSHQGPLSWSFLQRKDHALSFAFEYSAVMEKRKQFVTDAGLGGPMTNENGTPLKFENTSGEKREVEFNARKNVMNIYAVCSSDHPRLPQRIKAKLPTRSLLRSLIQNFMKNVWPFIGCIEPIVFEERITKIIGPLDSSDEDYPNYNCNEKEDLVYMGTLLIVLRLGFLSYISHGVRFDNLGPTGLLIVPLCKTLLDNPVDLSVIELAEECFKQFNLLVKPDLPLLQLALMMRSYQKFAPEFGEGLDGGDSQLFTGVLIQMAISIGLHRDPDSLMATRGLPAPTKMLRRRLWQLLLMTDVLEAYSFGNPINCHTQFFDTAIPKQSGTISEACIINRIHKQGALLMDHLREVLTLVLDISGRTRVVDVCTKMNQLELFMAELFPKIEDTLAMRMEDDNLKRERISVVKFNLSIMVFYIGVSTHLFLHYTQNGNQELSYFYCRKLLSIDLLQFIPNIFLLISRGQEVLGPSADLIIIPYTLQVTHRVFLSTVSLYVRLKFVHYSWTRMMAAPAPEALETLNAIIRGLDTIFNIIQAAMNKLAPRYYYAYKIVKIAKSTLLTIKDPAFYASYYPGAVALRALPFSADHLPELLEIINLSLCRLHESHKTQAELIVLLKQGPPMQPCGATISPLSHKISDAEVASNAQKSYQEGANVSGVMANTLADADIDEFFSRILSEMGETGDNWSPLFDDSLNLDFFYNV